jgi:hypothetical protein
MNNKIRQFLQRMSYFTAFLLISTIVTVFYWNTKNYQPLVFDKTPLVVNETNITPGSYISTNVSFCKNTDKDSLLTISFIDGFIYNTPPVISSFDKGCHTINYFLYVPKAIPEGEYNIKAIFRYRVNPIRDVDVVVVSEKFKVIR